MKLLKTLTVGLLLAASVGTASAQTVIHIVGSTAFRAPATAAIIDYLDTGGATVHAGITGAGTDLLGAGSAIIANGTVGTGGTATVIIETSWTGSLAGVVDVVAANVTGAYIDPSQLTAGQVTTFNASTVASNPYAATGAGLGTVTTVASAAEVAFSDSYQGTIAKELATGTMTAPIGSFSSISALATACASGVIVDAGTTGNAKDAGGTFGFVGIVPFEWVIGNVQDAAVKSAVSNISQQTSKGLIQTGYVPQSYLTGASGAGDTGNYFYFVGRNEDSGTRISYLTESQYGVTTSPTQFQVSGTTSVTTATKYPVTALNTEPNIIWNTLGHSGYAGGSNVKAALLLTENSASIGSFTGKSGENSLASYFVSSLGLTDAIGTVAGGGKALSFNGVPFSVAAVQNGQYTHWTYEHVYRLASLTGTALSAANTIADNVYLTDADIKSNGAHDAGAGLSAGILDNPTSPVLVFRGVVEGGTLSNY